MRCLLLMFLIQVLHTGIIVLGRVIQFVYCLFVGWLLGLFNCLGFSGDLFFSLPFGVFGFPVPVENRFGKNASETRGKVFERSMFLYFFWVKDLTPRTHSMKNW